MRLRLEMDALPRLFDMLLFVFIVRNFFMRLSTIEVLLARCQGRVRRQIPFYVWRFFSQKTKE